MAAIVDNERTKLAANAFDRLSTVLATVGAIAPVASSIYGDATTGLSTQFSIIATAVARRLER